MGPCPAPGSQHLYTYDAEGRLIATGGTQYEYNAAGERVSKDNAAGAPQTLYLHDGDGNQIAELNAALVVQHVNVYSGKHLVGTWNPATGQVYYAYSDWLGTKRYEADGGGNYVNSWASLPFGDNQTALGSGPDATEHHFTGQEHDAESGLDHFAARYYQSQTGRWLLPDWSATPVPVPYATLTNPQSLNLYTYVGNNPVNAVDADGHLPGSGGSTYTAQQGSALWQCVHTAPGNGNTDGCDFGAWGVDDSGLQSQGEDATQVALDQTADQKNSDAKAEQQNADIRENIAANAEAQVGSSAWAYSIRNGTFAAGTWKCNEFVGDMTKNAGAQATVLVKDGKPLLDAKGDSRPPTPAEWANKNRGDAIPNWRVLTPGETPQRGDVAPYRLPGCSDCNGHSGIVVGVGPHGEVRAIAAHSDKVGSDNSFQPVNGTVYSRFIGGSN
jgi:RHS repeat-associated protein